MRNLFSVVLFLSLLTACSNKQNTDNRTVEIVSQTSSPQTYSADNIPESKEAQWYNKIARDEVEKNELGNFKPSQQALVRLEAHLVEYLNNKLIQIDN